MKKVPERRPRHPDKDIENLMFAGRNISASHVALGALRVQGTTAVMGQATGTAAVTATGLAGAAPSRREIRFGGVYGP